MPYSKDVYYYENAPQKTCGNCQHRVYDSFNDESWCGHQPFPMGISTELVINPFTGFCDYWEVMDA